jgi:hypothetical protein
MGSPPLLLWIGVFLIGLIVGRWWFAVGAAVVVFIFVTATADLEASSAEVGFFASVAVLITLLCAIALRSLVVSLIRDVRNGRRERRHLD